MGISLETRTFTTRIWACNGRQKRQRETELRKTEGIIASGALECEKKHSTILELKVPLLV